MSRQAMALSALGAILLIVLFYFLLFQPKADEIAAVEEQIVSTEAAQQQLRSRITTLEEVRTRAPEIEAAISAAESIVPRDPGLPAVLRQLQLAADEAGITLTTVAIGRPTAVAETETAGLASLSVSLTATGGYFQLVDFLRRIEDPSITARGIVFSSITLGPEEYPTLVSAITGEMYAVLPAGEVEPAATTEDEADTETPDDVEDAA